jgi:hypothetical protein
MHGGDCPEHLKGEMLSTLREYALAFRPKLMAATPSVELPGSDVIRN